MPSPENHSGFDLDYDRLKKVFDSTPECIKVVDRHGVLLSMNRAGHLMVECDDERDIIGGYVFDLIAPEFQSAFRAMHERVMGGSAETLQFQIIGLKGTRRWVETRATPVSDPVTGETTHLAVTRDITARKQAEALVECQKNVLERIVAGADLAQTLEILTSTVETNSRRKVIATLLLANEERTFLYPVAGRSAPERWMEHIAKVPIAEGAGSCGASAFSRQPVVAEDIAHDPRWRDFKETALSLGLRACWSTPIISAERGVLGTFAIYYPEPTRPAPDEMDMVEILSRTAAVAIEKSNLYQALQRELARQKEAELNSRRLAAIVEGSDDAIVAKDLNGIIQNWNRGAERLFGYTAEEVIGKSITILIPEERLDEETEILRRLRAGQRVDHFETVRRKKNGELVKVAITVSPIRNSEGQIVGASKIARDVTPAKEAEVSRRRLAAIVESSDDAIIGLDMDTTITTWNRGAERMFGYSAQEAVGQSVTILLPPGYEDEEPSILRRLLAGERIEHYETVRCRKDGSLLNVSLTVSPIYDDAGKMIGASKISRDITEAKRQRDALRRSEEELKRHNERLEEEVARRTAQLRETIQELEAFSYSVSHDMRAPLRAMQGYADALIEDYESALDHRAVQYLDRIRRASARMDLLIQDVLAYSRIAKGEIQFGPLDVRAVIADVIQHYPALQPEHAEIVFRGEIPKVIAHEAYLTQVVSNILSNAVKFVAPGVFPRIIISAAEEGQMVRLAFRDNGIGIDPHHQGQVFQIFGRIYSDKKFEGTGIGLAIVKKAAERMGGSVGVVSQLGAGSEFFVLLKKAS